MTSIVHFHIRRVTKLVIFCNHHECMTPNWFKITTTSIIRGSSFFFYIKPLSQVHFDCNKNNPQPLPPLTPFPSPLITKL